MIRDKKNRTDLSRAIPIKTPFVVHIDTCNVCNFRCRFCTTGDHELLKAHNRPLGYMEFDLFCKIIDDLKEFETKIKDVIFHKNGEPLLHHQIVDMMRYAKRANVANRLMLVTNGSMLSPNLSREIMSIGIEYIQISMEAVSNEGYMKVSNVNIDYDKLVGNVAYLYANKNPLTTVNVKIMDVGLSEEEKKKFHDDFSNISDTHAIEHPISYTQPTIKDTSLGLMKGTTHDMYESTYKEVCTLPFYTLNINFNGRVSACSFDWRHGHIMGDANEERLLDIWQGRQFNDFRSMQLKKLRNQNPLCCGCEAVYNLLDNIDEDASEILKRLEDPPS